MTVENKVVKQAISSFKNIDKISTVNLEKAYTPADIVVARKKRVRSTCEACDKNTRKEMFSLESPDESDSATGYDVVLEDPDQSKRFQCKLCQKVMRNTIQTIRGELACKVCYDRALRSSTVCPIDGQPINSAEYFTDKYKTNEILNLRCLCTYYKEGCPWIKELRYLEEHLKACAYHPWKCPFCAALLMVTTPVQEHIEYCDGLLPTNNCFYAKYGCQHKFTDRKDHIKHLKDQVHLHMLLKEGSIKQTEITLLCHRLEALKFQNDERATAVASTITTLMQQFTLLEKSVQVMKENMSPPNGVAAGAISNKGWPTLEDKATLSLQMSAFNKHLLDIDLKQQIFENIVYNGRLLWKVDNFEYRMQQAIIGKVTALHSAPCFTEKYGYKFCARVYLNGDGIGKCTHISLFIVIMKSEYDNLLTWPFTKRVTLSLINQEDKSKSISESFIADRYSSSFQQPKRDLNVAAGCPMFASKEELTPSKGFLKDDSIFIEMSVE